MKEFIISEAQTEKAVLVGLVTPEQNEQKVKEYLDELAFLADTAGVDAVKRFTQKMDYPNSVTFVGTGKLQEIKEYVVENEIGLVIFDDELSPKQLRNIEKELQVKILDRTSLILDIFASRAQTAHAKTQVELAQYKYYLPRLTTWNEEMGRLGGGIGTRGPGETQLETDKRHIRARISKLQSELKEVRKIRAVQRERRMKNDVPVICLVGYTNAGKSTLLNAITGADIPANNRLFDTLDTTTRQLTVSDTCQALLSDTVGFIAKLPHHLVETFKSTLEEAAFADVIIKVADAGDAQAAEQLAVTDEVLSSLDCEGIPQLVVYNKCDVANAVAFDPDILLTSAKTGYGLPGLLAKLDDVLGHRVRTIELVLPYDKLALADILRSRGSVAAEEYREDGVFYRATVKIDDLHRFEPFLV